MRHFEYKDRWRFAAFCCRRKLKLLANTTWVLPSRAGDVTFFWGGEGGGCK